MSEIYFGLVFTGFSALFFYMFNFVEGETSGNIALANVIMLVFMTAGFVITANGVKKLIANKKTDLHGELCYGKITKVIFNGSVYNGVEQYDAYLNVYVESQGKIIEAHETIGDKVYQFIVDSFYAVKYYDGDINFEYPVPSFDALPDHIKEIFDTGEIIPDNISWNQGSEPSKTYEYSSKYNYDYEIKARQEAIDKALDEIGDDEFANEAYRAMLQGHDRI